MMASATGLGTADEGAQAAGPGIEHAGAEHISK